MQSIIEVARLGSQQNLEPGEVVASDLAVLAQGMDLEHVEVSPAWATWALDQLPVGGKGIRQCIGLLSVIQSVAFAITCAESVLDVFEARFPGTPEARDAIGSAKRTLNEICASPCGYVYTSVDISSAIADAINDPSVLYIETAHAAADAAFSADRTADMASDFIRHGACYGSIHHEAYRASCHARSVAIDICPSVNWSSQQFGFMRGILCNPSSP